MTELLFRVVAKASAIEPGKTLCVDIDGIEVLICHTKEGFFAVDNLCSHAEARLSEGKLKGCRILCPLHGAAFDVRDGQVLSRPASVALCSHPLRLDGDDILVALNPA